MNNTSTDTFRSLCEKLTDAYEHELNKRGMGCGLIDRARSALAQPEAEGPTYEELLDLASDHGVSREDIGPLVSTILDRWGSPAIEPVPVSERPWKREGWCDADGRCWWGRPLDELCNSDWFLATRADVEEFCDCPPPVVSLPHHALPVPLP